MGEAGCRFYVHCCAIESELWREGAEPTPTSKEWNECLSGDKYN